jgi:hypothetical protein
MTLQEKRLIANIEALELPKIKTQLKETLGFEPELEILWETFAGTDEYPFSRLTGVLFRDLNLGLKEVAKDQLGKEALQAAFTRIKIENTADSDATQYSLTDKELYLKVQLAGSTLKSPTPAQFRTWLEKNL